MRNVWRYSFVKAKEGIYLAEIYYGRIEKQGKEIFVNPLWGIKKDEEPLPSIEDWKKYKKDNRVKKAFSYGYYFVANENDALVMALDLETNEPRTDVIIVKTDKELPTEKDFIKITLDELRRSIE